MLSMILSGFFCGITSTSGKIFLDLVFLSGSINLLIDPLLYIVSALVVYSVFSNFYILNTAISLYTQLQTMPLYETCVIYGNLFAGGIIMNEFAYFNSK